MLERFRQQRHLRNVLTPVTHGKSFEKRSTLRALLLGTEDSSSFEKRVFCCKVSQSVAGLQTYVHKPTEVNHVQFRRSALPSCLKSELLADAKQSWNRICWESLPNEV